MTVLLRMKNILLMSLLAAVMSSGAGLVKADTVDVNIPGLNFNPAALTINTGTTVRWTNNHSLPHTTTSDNAAWDSGTLSTGQSFSYTFDTAGEFPYHCNIHPSMTASITVNQGRPVPSLSSYAFIALWLIIIVLAWGTYRRRAATLG
ncbi:MAG: hypothetical protein CVT49_11075 [candidate division Zixibacteria bacterium HGW-Zixibacteria-1]|nr:MAG: hypothetical protein CVT49_11075 [candidate division Zixibacteria bacterium HGW-Zixibacteria-1]